MWALTIRHNTFFKKLKYHIISTEQPDYLENAVKKHLNALSLNYVKCTVSGYCIEGNIYLRFIFAPICPHLYI